MIWRVHTYAGRLPAAAVAATRRQLNVAGVGPCLRIILTEYTSSSLQIVQLQTSRAIFTYYIEKYNKCELFDEKLEFKWTKRRTK